MAEPKSKKRNGRPKEHPAQTYMEMLEQTQKRKLNKTYRSESSEFNDMGISALVHANLEQLAIIAEQTADVDLYDTPLIKERTALYIRVCEEASILPSLMEFATSLGYSYDALQMFQKRHPEHPTTKWIKLLHDRFSTMLFNAGAKRYVDNASAIFGNKAMNGWTETVKIEAVQPEDPLGGQKSPEEIAQRYQYLPEAMGDTENA